MYEEHAVCDVCRLNSANYRILSTHSLKQYLTCQLLFHLVVGLLYSVIVKRVDTILYTDTDTEFIEHTCS